jgi:hypothetical protein
LSDMACLLDSVNAGREVRARTMRDSLHLPYPIIA